MGIASTHFQYHGYFPSGNEDDDYRATPLKCHLEDGSSWVYLKMGFLFPKWPFFIRKMMFSWDFGGTLFSDNANFLSSMCFFFTFPHRSKMTIMAPPGTCDEFSAMPPCKQIHWWFLGCASKVGVCKNPVPIRLVFHDPPWAIFSFHSKKR